MAKSRPKTRSKTRKRPSPAKKGGGGGGGGLMMAMRGGFQKAARSATGSGKKKPETAAGRILNWALTVALLGAIIYLVLKQFDYI